MLEKSKYNKGFTLMEVFIAMSVLAVGVVGAFGVLPVMIKNQTKNADSFLASQIANEGMELVRNLRDSNWLKEQDWKTGLSVSPSCLAGCEIDFNDLVMQPNQNRFLQKDTDGFYQYNNSFPDSKFKRKVTITPIGVVLNVKVEVSWTGNGSSFLIEENFYDWR